MSIFKIKSPYIFAELFSFIAKEQRKLKIIQYNNILIRKLCLSINDYKNYYNIIFIYLINNCSWKFILNIIL